MSEGYCHGVRRICLWRGIEIQKSHYHVFDLLFLCPSMTDDGGFDLGRAVRADIEIVASGARSRAGRAVSITEATPSADESRAWIQLLSPNGGESWSVAVVSLLR